MRSIDDDALATVVGLAVAEARGDTASYDLLLGPTVDAFDVDATRELVRAAVTLLSAMAGVAGTGSAVEGATAERVLRVLALELAARRGGA